MPFPPMENQEGIPTFGSLPQHVPQDTDSRNTPGEIWIVSPTGVATMLVVHNTLVAKVGTV